MNYKPSQLGQGTYGSVFLCRQKSSGRQCVIKRMQLNSLNYKERHAALQEAQLLQQLKHPNVVAYVDMHATRSKLFLFMQYCDGGDLEQRLNGHKKNGTYVHESQMLDWFVQMALALQYLHDKRILHRDLKTANIFLTRANIVKLGDFGVSRVLSATAELAKTFVGTPYYLSPELLSNLPYGPASDVWALGCILYEIATLEHPFDAKNFPSLATKIVNTEPEPIANVRPAFAGGDVRALDELFRGMILKQPASRAPLSQLLSAPIVQRRMLDFVREADPAAPMVDGGAKAAPPPPPPPKQQQASRSRTGAAAAREPAPMPAPQRSRPSQPPPPTQPTPFNRQQPVQPSPQAAPPPPYTQPHQPATPPRHNNRYANNDGYGVGSPPRVASPEGLSNLPPPQANERYSDPHQPPQQQQPHRMQSRSTLYAAQLVPRSGVCSLA